MDCTEFLNRYSDYDDSLVPPAEADRFRSHMAECERCSRYDRVLRKGRMLARQLPQVEPSDDFVPRLHARLWQWPDRHRPWPDAPGLVPGKSPRRWPSPPQQPLPRRPSPLSVMAVLLLMAAVGIPGHRSAELSGASLAASDAEVGAFHTTVAASTRAVLPPLTPATPRAPRGWAEARVDRAGRSSYSPLVTGPPAYRGGRLQPGASISAYRTLD